MNAEKVRDHWVAELTPPPVAGADGAASEPLLQALMRELGTAAIPILRPDPEHTWIWSDLHLGDRAMVDAWSRPFRNLTHMNRELLAEWRRRRPVLILTHSPLQRVPADTVNLHGHIHAAPAPTRQHRNLSVERPHSNATTAERNSIRCAARI